MKAHSLSVAATCFAVLLSAEFAAMGADPLPEFTFKGVVLHPKDLAYAPQGLFERACLVKMEGRVSNPLGKYYLYYSPHKPFGVGLVYSDSIEGPWTEYKGNPVVDHAAIPEVHWIPETGRFHLWAYSKRAQTDLWTSEDGLHFEHHSTSIAAKNIGTRNATYTRVYEYPLERYGNKYIMLYSGFDLEREIRCVWLAHSKDGENWTQMKTPLVEPIEGENNDIYGPSLVQWQGRHFIVYQDHTAYRGGNVKCVELDQQLKPVGNTGERLVLIKPVADSPIDNRYRECEFYREGDTIYMFASGGEDPRRIVYATAKVGDAVATEETKPEPAARPQTDGDQPKKKEKARTKEEIQPAERSADEQAEREQTVSTSPIVMNILRPKLKGEQVSPTWTEINYLMVDARHPDGIEKLQLWKPGAKKAERSFTEADRHKSGYFFYKRRFKSGEVRDYKILLWPGGTDPKVDPPITSDVSFLVEYRHPNPEFPDYLGFTNLGDGDVVAANDPSKPSDLTYVYLDCMDSSGTWGEGNWAKAMHVGYKDDDGIKWVELVINGPDGETVVRNETALIFDADRAYHGPYWGEPLDPKQTKLPEEPWPQGVKCKPIEGFGLYEFAVPLKPGKYKLSIRAKNNDNDNDIIEGPAISITTRDKQ